MRHVPLIREDQLKTVAINFCVNSIVEDLKGLMKGFLTDTKFLMH